MLFYNDYFDKKLIHLQINSEKFTIFEIYFMYKVLGKVHSKFTPKFVVTIIKVLISLN